MRHAIVCFAVILSIALASAQPAADAGEYSWNAPDRAVRVAALTPGRKIPHLTPDNLFAEWTQQQVQKWRAEHGEMPPDEAYARYAAAQPTDSELTADFPRHICPFGQVRSGKPEAGTAEDVLISYCPFCGSKAFSLAYDQQNSYHATTRCCGTELYGRVEDAPADYALRPNDTVSFLHLDETMYEAPCTVYTDKNGVEWELFIRTIFDQRRWLSDGCSRVRQYMEQFKRTADPVCAHKIAVILDEVADTYYGLPLCYRNKLAKGKDGQPLTRAEWEALPRPAIFEVGPLGGWNRRTPIFNQGWLNMSDEHIWVEPFARVRNHPAFKYYSQKKYGDPEALERKIMQKLLRELVLMFKSVFSQKLLHNYQEANYVDMWLLGILAQDDVLTRFAGPAQETTVYNHTYQDGLNGEGAPNYMAMPGGYFYPFLKSPDGWLQYYPSFLEDHPFYWAADGEMRKLYTVRGMPLEFGDQHEYAYPTQWHTDAARVAENEKIGSRNWAGYGVGVLRFGGPGHRQEMCLGYSRASLHNAHDALSLSCWVDGVPVMRKGGYAAGSLNVPIQWERPEFQALKQMDYPRAIEEAGGGWSGWARNWVRSPMCQNTATVEEMATGGGWGDDRGYGEVVTFKGGEAGGEPGSGLQVLDVVDHYSWSRVEKDVSEYRRTVIGVEGPDGRPYALDVLKIKGGQRHQLYQSVWAERAEDKLPAVVDRAQDLAQVFFGGQLPEDTWDYRNYTLMRDVEVLEEPGETWELTWKTDIAAYAPRPVDGSAFQRPLPDDVGRVRLRSIGIAQPQGKPELLRAKAPYIGIITQPLPNNQRLNGNVSIVGGRDMMIEHRASAAPDTPLDSLYVHILEGYREGEQAAIVEVSQPALESTGGAERDVICLRLSMAGGHTDTLVYQAEPGEIRTADGLETDARYAVVRQDADGNVFAVDACRGSYLRLGEFRLEAPGDFTGEVVDIIGDITGTRQQSALIIQPDKPWPGGSGLHDRQLLLRFESDLRNDGNEGYRIEKTTVLDDGRVRVDMQDAATFITSWHEVTELPADQPNAIKTWRPMVDYGNHPWYNGLELWFPEKNKSYTIERVNRVGGGYGGDTVTLIGNANPSADGIEVGDWYVINGVRPGLRVSVPNDICWRRESAEQWTQYALRATGPVTIGSPALSRPLWFKPGDDAWVEAPQGKQSFSAAETDGTVRMVIGKPEWLQLNDAAPPQLARMLMDGKELVAEQARDMNWIDPPKQLVITLADADNQLDMDVAAILLNGQRLTDEGGMLKTSITPDGRGVEFTINLEQALADRKPRRHTIQVHVSDRSVDRHSTDVQVSFLNRADLEGDVIYLSDLTPVKSFAHGGLMRDRDYVGNVAEITRHVYQKCITLCPEPSTEGAHGEGVYELPEQNLILHADIGISDSSRGAGSVTFEVHVGDTPDGPWKALYKSPRVNGGDPPIPIEVSLGAAGYLRIYTTDAGDNINSDHAVWGDARLK